MIKIGINVLSLCDGMSGGQIALKELGIEIDKYFAFEIKNTAIKTTQLNFPNTIQLGDVSDFDISMLQGKHIDLFLCGSPCQNMSLINITGKVGIEGEKSKLFYRLVRKAHSFRCGMNSNIVKMGFEMSLILTLMFSRESLLVKVLKK